MSVSGKSRLGVLILAEAPGENEDHQGIQLVGKSGKRLEKACLQAGIDIRKDCWLTNAIICRPPGNKIPENRPVVDYCRPNLVKTINELKPKMILVLGGTAIQSLIGWVWPERSPQFGVTRWAGYRIPDRKLNAWICPTYHPAHVMRAEDGRTGEIGVLSMLFDSQVKRAFLKKDRPYPKTPKPLERKVEIYPESKFAIKAVNEVLGEGPVTFAFDYETNMGNPDHPDSRIVCMSISTGIRGRTLSFPWTPEVREAVVPYLTDKRYPKIGANCKFEDRWTRKHTGKAVAWGPDPYRTWDCMLAAHAIDNGNGKARPVTGVKFQAYARLGVGNYSDRVEPYLKPKTDAAGERNRIHEVDIGSLLTYCGIDSLVEYELAKVQCKDAAVPFPSPVESS